MRLRRNASITLFLLMLLFSHGSCLDIPAGEPVLQEYQPFKEPSAKHGRRRPDISPFRS
ncbi:hypothetical protein PAHAL_9G198400 [Panicum hallii]|uniref:Uncharacterized protein n=1 Tax=Panicum hallii TaxID=206008 RepID=A0A2T8I1W1_9POAL|nr:hypothetical protein PAHAL_9G198400 [Panicum hallii]